MLFKTVYYQSHTEAKHQMGENYNSALVMLAKDPAALEST